MSKKFCSRCNVAVLNFCLSNPTIQLDSLGDKQLFFGKCENNGTSNILMAGTTWYTLLLIMPIQRPLFLRTLPKLLLNSQEENHSLVKTRSLMLAALKITGKP